MIKPEKKPVEPGKTNLYGQEFGSDFGWFLAQWVLSTKFGVSVLGKVPELNSTTQLGVQR